MAFIVTARQSGNSGQVAAQTLTTDSATESASSLLLVGSAAQNDQHSAAQNGQTLSGGGLTYTQVAQSAVVPFSGSANFRMRGAVHSAAVSGSPSAHTITVDHYIEGAGGDEGFYCATAVDVTGHSPADPIVQSATNAASLGGGSSESGTVTLGSTPTADNLVVVWFFAGADGGGGFAAPTIGGQSMTEAFNQNNSWTQAGCWYRVIDGTESNAVITCSDLGQSVGQYAAAAVEIQVTSSGDTDADAGAATIAAVAQDIAAMVMPTAEEATVSTVAHDPTTTRTGEPDAGTATVVVAAQDATVDAVGDATEANAEVATVTVDANSDHILIATAASRASVAVASQGPDITATGQPNAGLNFISVSALDATVTIGGEGIAVNAEVASVSVVAHNATPTGEANAEAEAATISVTAEDTDKRAFAGLALVDVEARDAQVAIDAGVIATAERAEVQVAALNATVAVSDNVSDTAFVADVAVAALNATVSVLEPPPPTYSFFPPTVNENLHMPEHPDADFIQRLYWERGLSVVQKDGQFVTVRYVVPENLDGQTEGVHYFVGGFHYSQIPEDVALQLIADGYEPELNEV